MNRWRGGGIYELKILQINGEYFFKHNCSDTFPHTHAPSFMAVHLLETPRNHLKAENCFIIWERIEFHQKEGDVGGDDINLEASSSVR